MISKQLRSFVLERTPQIKLFFMERKLMIIMGKYFTTRMNKSGSFPTRKINKKIKLIKNITLKYISPLKIINKQKICNIQILSRWSLDKLFILMKQHSKLWASEYQPFHNIIIKAIYLITKLFKKKNNLHIEYTVKLLCYFILSLSVLCEY